jgi:hypothetical protein
MVEYNSTVLFVGAIPPPVGGQRLINQKMMNLLRSRCRLITVDVSSGLLERSLAYHFRRIVRVCRGLGIILLHAGAGHRFYLSTDSGWGLLYNVLMVIFARLAHYSIFLQHQSFSFINRRSPLMAMLVAVAGRHATHIFLCDLMRDRFKTI